MKRFFNILLKVVLVILALCISTFMKGKYYEHFGITLGDMVFPAVIFSVWLIWSTCKEKKERALRAKAENQKKCPHCSKYIDEANIVCTYCRKDTRHTYVY